MSGETKARKPDPGGYCVGPYRIERPLGFDLLEGVYLARHTLRDTEVALRIFRISKAEGRTHEPFALSRLSHPNIASIHSAERIDDHLVVAMDYVEGATLQDILREKGRLDPRESLRILSGVTSALDYIHSLPAEGVRDSAHLDLKPSDVFVGRNGAVKISDFRLARLVAAGAPHIDQILRSQAYLAPEQLEGGASPKSDLWAAGILFFEMLVGRTPRQRESLEGKALSLRDLDAKEGPDFASLPDPCRRIILRCLQPNPAERFTSAHEMAAALSAAAPALDLPSCPTCGSLLPHGVNEISEPAVPEIRALMSERTRRYASPFARVATRFLMLGAAVTILAAALTLGAFWLRMISWKDPGASQPAAESPGPALEMQSLADTVKETGDNLPAGRVSGNPRASPPTVTAAGREGQSLSGSAATGGVYGVRLDQLAGIVERSPGSSEAMLASEMIRSIERESAEFTAAEDLEQKQDSTMCEKLARWQEFLTRQTTGLRRDFALGRVQHWKRQVQNYVGGATLTLRSVTGLPEEDSGFLDSGKPDPYLVLLDGKQVLYRTQTIKDSSSPPWYREIRIYIWRGMNLYLDIWDDNIFGSRLMVHQPLNPLPLDGIFQVSSGGITIELEIRRDR